MIIAAISVQAPETVKIVLGFFQRGGLFMWPLLACSIVSLTTMILRGFALREKKVMPPAIEEEIERLVPGGGPERLSRLVHHDLSSLAQITLGIAEALNGSVFGLSIAVPTLIGFTYFSRKVEVMSVEMETLVVELINKCYYGRSSREFERTKPSSAAQLSTPVA